MIKFFSDRYRLYRKDHLNLVLQKRYTKEIKMRQGEEIGGGEGWKGVGPYHQLPEHALVALIDDMLMDNIGDEDRIVEVEKFKRNIVSLKKLLVSKMKETMKQFIAMERGELEEEGEETDD